MTEAWVYIAEAKGRELILGFTTDMARTLSHEACGLRMLFVRKFADSVRALAFKSLLSRLGRSAARDFLNDNRLASFDHIS